MPNRKFLNQPDRLVDELLEGFVLAHQDKVRLAGSNLVVRAQAKPNDKVAIVTGAPFPAVLVSRADDDDSKYYSIVLAAAKTME